MSAPALAPEQGIAPAPGPAPAPATGDRRSRTIAVIVVIAALVAALGAALARGAYRDAPFEPSSPAPGGSKAVVTVLRDGGATVRTERRTAEAAAALRSGDTVLVTAPSTLDRPQLEALREALDAGDGRLVLVTPDFGGLAVLAPGVRPTGTVEDEDARLSADAECSDASFAARTVRPGPVALDADGDQVAPAIVYSGPETARGCFRTGAGASIMRSGDVTVLGSARYLTNAGVGGADNAAVALNALGDGHVVWYLPSAADPMASTQPGAFERLPDWMGPVGLWLAVCVLVLLVALMWRGGPVVVEPLPVTVRAQELTAGRARLMHRAGARESAARSLRSATAVRLASRLGIRRGESLDALVAAAAPLVGRSPAALRELLGETPVRTDEELVRLADDLDRLEKEIDR
ncbi:DUF4350 domain-containing protein [Brachybacterium huguangmaarense]|uniref:DUF4350 domain-containing protein n=1 Tax=Brachybacterium huguangmaarense TaxID=1652028 RepID=A0ABY6FXQ9_9MICO|nr:DUF4350 domain-containing protein [Brachybacterium huguangmaarense]UYG15708.1 DUF4350 domain-containing protein [Brachybacterium huguangmaarense]